METFRKTLLKLLKPVARLLAALKIHPHVLSMSGILLGIQSGYCFVLREFPLADLSDTNLLILRAATMVADKFARKVFRAYEDLARGERERICSYVHFNNQLSYLQSLGLVLMISVKVNRTYANKVKILCNEGIIRQVYEIRFQ